MEENKYIVEDECKLLTALGKILKEEPNCPSEEEILSQEDDIMVLDPANVMGVIAKTNRARRLLRRFMDKDRLGTQKVPELRYDDLVTSKSKFSTDYMVHAVNLFKVVNALKGIDADESCFVMRVGNDYPLTMSNKDWAIILAPRIDTD